MKIATTETVAARLVIRLKIKRKLTNFLSKFVNLSWRCHPDLNWGWSFCRALPYHLAMAPHGAEMLHQYGASDEARTRYLHLGKVALYQMSYTRISERKRVPWCLRPESNQRHGDFQSPALPTELQRQVATRKGLEPSTSGVTGRRSNQLNYRARWCRH